jgi:hypothetical protein
VVVRDDAAADEGQLDPAGGAGGHGNGRADGATLLLQLRAAAAMVHKTKKPP